MSIVLYVYSSNWDLNQLIYSKYFSVKTIWIVLMVWSQQLCLEFWKCDYRWDKRKLAIEKNCNTVEFYLCNIYLLTDSLNTGVRSHIMYCLFTVIINNLPWRLFLINCRVWYEVRKLCQTYSTYYLGNLDELDYVCDNQVNNPNNTQD